jgi:hypothetical protein
VRGVRDETARGEPVMDKIETYRTLEKVVDFAHQWKNEPFTDNVLRLMNVLWWSMTHEEKATLNVGNVRSTDKSELK